MKVIDAQSFTDFASKLSANTLVHSSMPLQQQILKPWPLPISFTPVITTLERNGTTIGYVITPAGSAAPTSAGETLPVGTLWFNPQLLGASFAASSGWVGIPFVNAVITGSGNVTWAAQKITLDPAATCTCTLAPSVTTAAAIANSLIGEDFALAKLTPFSGATITFAPSGVTLAVSGQATMTAYGASFQATPIAGATPLPVLFGGAYVALPCAAAQANIVFTTPKSPELVLNGTAQTLDAGTLFPILNVDPTTYTSALDAWGLVFRCGAGISARFGNLRSSVATSGLALALTPGQLFALFATGTAQGIERYPLWHASTSTTPAPSPTTPDLALPDSVLNFELTTGALVSFSESPTLEVLLELGILNAQLDRPLAADGSRIPLSGPGILRRSRDTSGISVAAASALTPNLPQSIALVAENALIPVQSPNGFVLEGQLQNGRLTGSLGVTFPTALVVATLPDPYAALYVGGPESENLSGIEATITWTVTVAPTLHLTLLKNTPAGTENLATAVLGPTRGALAFALLDLSTNADQWGVGAWSAALPQLSFDAQRLTAPNADAFVFTVPGISWEPVVDDSAGVPAWLAASTPNDGTPTVFLVQRTTPTPLVPIDALTEYQQAADTNPTSALFTLPFGISAAVSGAQNNAKIDPTYTLPEISFPKAGANGMSVARALSIRGQGLDPLGITLPGAAAVGFDTASPAASAYGAQVLGVLPLPSPADFWDQQFAVGGKTPAVPISRIDLSGYGTSLYSDWRDPSLTDVGVIRALFDVNLGRTAHEIVQLQTWIMPWSIRLQRSVVFDRSDSGEVVKHDSGWKAVDVGKFELLGGQVLNGPISELRNVRNIVFDSAAAITVAGKKYIPLTFEADVAYTNTLTIAADGQNPAATSVGLQIVGFADDTVGSAPSPSDVIALMQQVGRVSGVTQCIARVGGTTDANFTFSVTGFTAALATGATPKLQTALLGTPKLAKDNAWSVGVRAASAAAPQTLAAGTPVPLTIGTPSSKPAPTGGNSYTHGWRLLNPEDAQAVDTPQTFYGMLQDTGVGKTLYEHPLISDIGNALGFGNLPSLADVGSLLGIANIFPDLASALQIPSTDDLPLHGDGFSRTYSWTINEPDRSLLDIAIVHLALAYSAGGTQATGKLVLNAQGTPTWQLNLDNLSFQAIVDGFGSGPMLAVTGGFAAGSNITPGFTNLNVDYGSALSAVQAMFSGLSTLAKDLGGSADLDIGFSGNTLTVQQGFTLPTIPLGFGDISDLGINLGFSATIPSDLQFSVGIGSQDEPFQWVVSPLAGTGAIVLGVAGGALDVFIEAGLGIGLSLSVAVASGSASIVVSLSLAIKTGTVTIIIMLTGNADVEVLGGLASASLTLSAALGISFPIALPPPDATLTGQIAVGIHISICWVIDIDFDGSWSFSETISLN